MQSRGYITLISALKNDSMIKLFHWFSHTAEVDGTE